MDNKRAYITGVTTWSFVILGGYHSMRALYDNFALSSMFSSPGFMLGLAGSTVPVELPPLARLAAQNMRFMFILYFLVSISVFVTGIGLLLKRAWAFGAARSLFYTAAACCLVILLFPGLLVPEPFVHEGIAPAPEFNEAVGRMRFWLRVIIAPLGAAAFWAGAAGFEKKRES